MSKVRNVLFIMCDQLRADHLGRAGHPTLQTPNLDRLAAQGVRFENAFVQSGVCGPSRMSYYTGRYVLSHGATWNRVPLSVHEWTIGDYLKPAGLAAVLAGKTHMVPDTEAMERLDLNGGSALAALLRQGGFRPIDRYDGHSPPGRQSGYADYLRAKGYASKDPWSDYVIAAEGADGEILSGWQMRNARLPARVREEDSETAYMTDQAIRFIESQGKAPWFLHLSYVKPHWPYMAPAPYHAMYGPNQALPVNRSPAELEEQHPVLAAYRRQEECVNFSRDETIAAVRPTYMGLISQLDAHLGRILAVLERSGRLADTLIVFTSDHGDFLGDHWLGEKEIFYDEAIRVPLIIVDPDTAADGTRGQVDGRLVEAIDVLPTCLEALKLPIPAHRLEGRSLLPLLRGHPPTSWRDFVISELDYSFREARLILNRGPRECRAFMLRTKRWKYVLWHGFRPQLFDLLDDPFELSDRGDDPGLARVQAELHEQLFAWMRVRENRTTASDTYVEARTARHKDHGIYYGVW